MEKVSFTFNRISRTLQKIEMILGCLCLFALLTVMLINVLMRYVLALPLFWADEVNNFLFVWFGLLGVAYIMGNNAHLRVTALVDALPRTVKKVSFYLTNLVMLVMFGIFIEAAVRLLSIVTFSGLLRIPLKYIYLILPLSFGLMCFHIINNVLQSFYPSETEEETAPEENQPSESNNAEKEGE